MEPLEKQDPEHPVGPLIFAYTRRQALEDGVLVDVTVAGREAGFRWPLALTAEVWTLIEVIPGSCPGRDLAGRLWDVLMCARAKTMAAPPGEGQLLFQALLHHAGGSLLQLKLVAGPGDQGEPVLTIMLPEQD